MDKNDIDKIMDEIKKNNEQMLKFYRSPLSERFSLERFAPYYNDKADYNTDSASYYDFLARYLRFIRGWQCIINGLLARELKTADTSTITLHQDGTWETEDDITLTGDVKLSTQLDGDYPNAIVVHKDGLYSKDLSGELGDLENTVNKIIKNLQDSGAWHGDAKNGDFNPGRNIATGNINVFTDVQDGNTFIRTNNGQTENDVALTTGK